MMKQPDISYLICATERSGSTLLCEALTLTGVAGVPVEYLCPDHAPAWQKRWGVFGYEDYLATAMRQTMTSNGVFGAKFTWSPLYHFLHEVQRLPRYQGKHFAARDLLNDVFPNLHYIWIKRRDKVRQAVSLAKAVQTSVWRVTAETPVANPHNKALFSFNQIDLLLRRLQADELAWQKYFSANHIQPFVVEYEDFVLHYEQTAIQILQYLGISDAEAVRFGARSMKKQADEETEQWVQRYYYLKQKSKRYQFISYKNKVHMEFIRVKQAKGLIVKGLFKPMFRLNG